jgi:hypothetical protein
MARALRSLPAEWKERATAEERAVADCTSPGGAQISVKIFSVYFLRYCSALAAAFHAPLPHSFRRV